MDWSASLIHLEIGLAFLDWKIVLQLKLSFTLHEIGHSKFQVVFLYGFLLMAWTSMAKETQVQAWRMRVGIVNILKAENGIKQKTIKYRCVKE